MNSIVNDEDAINIDGADEEIMLDEQELIDQDVADQDKSDYEPQAAIDSTHIAPASNIFKWYVLHTYSGYEQMVKDNLEMVFKKNELEDRLETISIPMEDSVEDRNGKKKVVRRRLFPCYVYVKMDYDNSLWHMITKTRGVTGFVGPQGRPLPLTDDEVRRLRLEAVTVVEMSIKVGDKVRVVSGSFEGNEGEVESVDSIKGRARLKVDAFGRSTSMEFELYQIESI